MRIITREDINQLKLQRKIKLRRIRIISCLAIVLVGGVVAAFLFMHQSKREKGAEINTNTNPHMGDGYGNHTASGTDALNASDSDASQTNAEMESPASASDASLSDAAYDYYDWYVSNASKEDYEYELSENSLPDIEEITGNNWADEDTFVHNSTEPIPLNYFDDAVFVGDSRTEGLLLYSNLANINGICYKGLNVGVLDSEKCISMPGEKEKVTCFDAISNSDYNYYYCMFGVNELGWVDVESFIDCFESLIDHIYSVNPDAIVYVESIMPVTKKLSEDNDIYKIDKINEYNEKLLAMCQRRKDVIYLDVFSAVADEEGYLPEDASTDGVHCGVSYCMRVIQYIRMNTYSRIK